MSRWLQIAIFLMSGLSFAAGVFASYTFVVNTSEEADTLSDFLDRVGDMPLDENTVALNGVVRSVDASHNTITVEIPEPYHSTQSILVRVRTDTATGIAGKESTDSWSQPLPVAELSAGSIVGLRISRHPGPLTAQAVSERPDILQL